MYYQRNNGEIGATDFPVSVSNIWYEDGILYTGFSDGHINEIEIGGGGSSEYSNGEEMKW